MLVDYHMHLRQARADGVEEIDHTLAAVERYVEVAAGRGIDEIGFTEHVYYFGQTEALWTVAYQQDRCHYDLDVYCDAVAEARRQGYPVKLGIEVDFVRGREQELAEILAPYPWDYQLVSVHWIDGAAVDQQPGIWEGRTVAEVWELYFEHLEAAAASGLYDVLAHPDLAKLFGDRPGAEIASALYASTAVACAAAGTAVEVSTAGLEKPVAELYPTTELLEACRDRGVPITLASDAHFADDVGRDLGRAVEHAQAAGYETVTVFEGREARQEPLG